MRLSGSVTVRCALPSGSAFGGAGVLPVVLPPSALRLSWASARALLCAAAAARASTSSSAVAWRIFSSQQSRSPSDAADGPR